MIVPRSLFRCGLAIESIAQQLMTEPIPQLDDEIGTRAGSARVGNTLHFSKNPLIVNKYSALFSSPRGRVKYSG
jgi:hypothetical protein